MKKVRHYLDDYQCRRQWRKISSSIVPKLDERIKTSRWMIDGISLESLEHFLQQFHSEIIHSYIRLFYQWLNRRNDIENERFPA